MIGHPALRRREAFVDLHSAKADVVCSEKRECFGGRSVTARTANFLVIGFDAFRQIGVRDPADVGFVDTHAESDGSDHDETVVRLKTAFDVSALIGLHTCVVGKCIVIGVTERLRQRFGFGPRPAIDNSRLAFSSCCKVQDLLARFIFGGEGQVNIWAIKPTKELARLRCPEQLLDDLGASFVVSGGSEGGQRYVKGTAQRADAEVVGAEVVAPLANAVGFVDGQKRDTGVGQHTIGAAGAETFGGHVKDFEGAVAKSRDGRIGLCLGVRGAKWCGGQSRTAQGADLIAHKSDER